jgi:hypothetical protein
MGHLAFSDIAAAFFSRDYLQNQRLHGRIHRNLPVIVFPSCIYAACTIKFLMEKVFLFRKIPWFLKELGYYHKNNREGPVPIPSFICPCSYYEADLLPEGGFIAYVGSLACGD